MPSASKRPGPLLHHLQTEEEEEEGVQLLPELPDSVFSEPATEEEEEDA